MSHSKPPSSTEPRPDSSYADQTSLAQQSLDLFPAVLAGLIAVLISYSGPLLLVLQAAQAAKLSPEQMASWLWAISIGAGVCGVWLSWKYRMPVICAWNSPGAALLVTSLATVPYSEAIAAYLFAAVVMWLIGVSGLFERLMASIPKSLCAAMLAGILFRFGVDVFAAARSEVGGAALLVASIFIGYLVFKRYSARYAIVLSLLLGIFLWLCFSWGDVSVSQNLGSFSELSFSFTRPRWTTPEFSVSSIISIGLPLAVLCLTGQQVPGIAVLRAANFAAPTSKLVAATGFASIIMAPFGAHGINLAAITAAICTGPEAHHQAEKRWVAGVACGIFYITIGSFAGSLVFSFMHLPPALVATVAGLALLGAIQNGLVNALAEPSEREAALITFIITASNVSLFGLGSACWGIALGLLSYFVLRPRRTST